MSETLTVDVERLAPPGVDEQLLALEAMWNLPAAVRDLAASPEAKAQLLPAAVRVQDLAEFGEAKADFARGLGSLAVGQVLPPPESAAPRKSSILRNLERAAVGDREALGQDALLALVEAILEEGVNEVDDFELNEHGEFVQHDTKLHDIVADAIRYHPGEHAGIQHVTRLEGLNISVMHMLERKGYFAKGYVWFVPRLAPQTVPAKYLWGHGYFKNIAVAGNLIWQRPNGKFASRSLFMAGAPIEEGDESASQALEPEELYDLMERRLAKRHDITAIRGMWQEQGLVTPDAGEDAIAAFQLGALFHRNQFEHPDEPDVDVAQWYDRQLGPGYFLGRKGASGDYLANSRKSIADMRRLADKKEALIDEMVAEFQRRGGDIHNMQAGRLMARIARKHAIDYVIDNPDVDASPLGRHIVTLRDEYWRLVQSGNAADAGQIRRVIHKEALVNSCGYGDKPKESLLADVAKNKKKDDKDKKSDRRKGFKNKAKRREQKERRREWMYCVHCPLCDRDGVDAYIDYYPQRKKKRITCCSCKGHKDYDHKS